MQVVIFEAYFVKCFTIQTSLQIEVAGWEDDVSGIKNYELELYRLKDYAGMLGYRAELPIIRKSLQPTIGSIKINYSDPGKTVFAS